MTKKYFLIRKGWKASGVKSAHVKAWRKRNELTMSEAAEEIGVSKSTFSYYEKGERPDSNGLTLKEPKKVRIPKMFGMACLAYEHVAKELFAKMGIGIDREDGGE